MNTPRLEIAFRSEKVDYLNHFSQGESGTVVDLIVDPELQGRLMGMGLFVGTRFHILQKGKTSTQPMLLAIGETRIALGPSIASNILVER
jgi:Fe2+ transport system protein FeoA